MPHGIVYGDGSGGRMNRRGEMRRGGMNRRGRRRRGDGPDVPGPNPPPGPAASAAAPVPAVPVARPRKRSEDRRPGLGSLQPGGFGKRKAGFRRASGSTISRLRGKVF